MSRIRVVYVENDPALRGVMSQQLKFQRNLEIVATFGNSKEALEFSGYREIDAALLDLALGPDSLNGTELAIMLREQNPKLGVVIYSQHVAPDYLHNLPTQYRAGWSYIEKRGDLHIEDLAAIIVSTAKGSSTLDAKVHAMRGEYRERAIALLSARQRQIMSLAATGLDANAIAKQLNLAPITIRQDLSKAYAILIPNPEPGTDLRTSAVLTYLREVRRDDEII